MARLLWLVIAIAACASQKPPPKTEYAAPDLAVPYPGSPVPSPYDSSNPPPQPFAQPYAPPTQTMGAPVAGPEGYRAPSHLVDPALHYSFNGHTATQNDLVTLAQIERLYGAPVPEGDYWYDSASGAAGRWGGPTLGFLPPGLALGGRVPANASGGGDGRLTGVWINGRELHPVDVQVMTSIVGKAVPGRWWVDAQGNAGQDGGPAVMNLIALARQRGKAAVRYYRSDGRGTNAFVGGGCVSVSGGGSDNKTADYSSAGC